jgi:membrane protein required for colicin V production
MQAYDIIMLIVLGAAMFLGFRKGLAWQIASVAAIVVSYLVAMQFRDVLASRIDAEPPWNTFLAMLILYIGTSFAIWLVFQMVRGFIDRAKLHEFDRQLGAIFGLAKGVLLCVIITLFAVTLLGDEQRQQIINSRSGLYIARLLDRADAVMPEELHDFLHPYLHRLEGELGPAGEGSEMDDLRRLEDWLESGQGGSDWNRPAPSGSSGAGPDDARYGGSPATPYRAETPSRQRGDDVYQRR